MFAYGLSNLIIFIVILGGLILVHELGHLLVGLRCGVRVKEIGIGLPPRLIKIGSIGDTLFTLNWIPLGGFVLFDGELEATSPHGLAAQTPAARLAILASGSICNLCMGYLLLVLTFTAGTPDRIKIQDINVPSPAHAAGLQSNDLVLKIDGREINSNRLLREKISDRAGQSVMLEIQRGTEQILIELIPREVWPEGQGPAGFTSTMRIVRYPVLQAITHAGDQWGLYIKELILLPVRLINRQIEPGEVRLLSPVGLKQISDQAIENASSWNEWFPILNFAAAISITLGLTNLLPLPALDGGRIFFVLLEAIRGKAVNAKWERAVHGIGLVALLGMTLVLIIQDLINPML